MRILFFRETSSKKNYTVLNVHVLGMQKNRQMYGGLKAKTYVKTWLKYRVDFDEKGLVQN